MRRKEKEDVRKKKIRNEKKGKGRCQKEEEKK